MMPGITVRFSDGSIKRFRADDLNTCRYAATRYAERYGIKVETEL